LASDMHARVAARPGAPKFSKSKQPDGLRTWRTTG
jgi:hypothetical protein